MRIDSYTVNLQGSSKQKTYHSVKEDLQIWFTEQPEQNPAIAQSKPQDLGSLSLSVPRTEGKEEEDYFQLSDTDKLKIQLLEEFIKLMTGKDYKFKIPKGSKKSTGYNGRGHAVGQQVSGQSAGFGLVYNRFEEKAVRTTVNFKADGVVKTSDGKEISFSAAFRVDQSLVETAQTQIRMGDALKDPLVINFSGATPQFSQTTFEFDLLADGKSATIHQFSSDSAYLALDKNNNGVIDNGSELFGPTTNYGFSELKAYDLDNNNWIDENDAIFSSLKLWSKNSDGSDTLVGLLDRDVGAIYLGNVATKLDLYAATDQAGRLRDTGIVLTETGRTLTIQEIDLKV